MKYLLIPCLLFLSIAVTAQSRSGKLSRDSVRYYQTELNKLTKNTFDSLKNSERYQYIQNKLNAKNRPGAGMVELLAYVGMYFTDFKNLNNRLKSIGQKELKALTPSVGASLAVTKRIITYGLELSAYTFDNKNVAFKGAHFRYYIATNLFKRSPVILHPQIGYSFSFLNMFINKSSAQINFNDLFTSNANTVQLSQWQDYLDFALGFKLRNRKIENFYWQIVRVGYRMGLKEKVWKMRGGEILDAPKDRSNQFYVQLCLGFDRD